MLTVEQIKNFDICKDLSLETLTELAALFNQKGQLRQFKAGVRVINDGQLSKDIMIPVKGKIKCIRYTPQGEEIFYMFFSENQTIGIVRAFTNRPSQTEFITLGPAQLLILPAPAFLKMLQQYPEFMQAVFQHICFRIDDNTSHNLTARLKKSRHRICNFLLIHCQRNQATAYTIPFTIDTLAKYLNLTRPNLSKELHQLEREGLVSISKNTIYINDLDKLSDVLYE